MSPLGSDICGVVQGRVDHLETTVERTTSKMLQMMGRCWEAEGQYHKSEETLGTLRKAVDADLVSTQMLALTALCLVPACGMITM